MSPFNLHKKLEIYFTCCRYALDEVIRLARVGTTLGGAVATVALLRDTWLAHAEVFSNGSHSDLRALLYLAVTFPKDRCVNR